MKKLIMMTIVSLLTLFSSSDQAWAAYGEWGYLDTGYGTEDYILDPWTDDVQTITVREEGGNPEWWTEFDIYWWPQVPAAGTYNMVESDYGGEPPHYGNNGGPPEWPAGWPKIRFRERVPATNPPSGEYQIQTDPDGEWHDPPPPKNGQWIEKP